MYCYEFPKVKENHGKHNFFWNLAKHFPCGNSSVHKSCIWFWSSPEIISEYILKGMIDQRSKHLLNKTPWRDLMSHQKISVKKLYAVDHSPYVSGSDTQKIMGSLVIIMYQEIIMDLHNNFTED